MAGAWHISFFLSMLSSSQLMNYSKERVLVMLLVSCLLISLAWGSAETCADTIGNTNGHPESDVVSQLVDWLRENGAYINEKLVVRQLAPEDPTSPRGVFTTEDMDAGETVCVIPWDLMLKPSEQRELEDIEDCETIHATFDAISGGGKTPYAKYLLAQPKDYLPSFWSQAARDLLHEMLRTTRANHLTKFDQLPPRGIEEVIERDVLEWCNETAKRMSEPLFRQAVMLVKARADYNYMVPFYDMMNHHNGKYNVAHRYNPYVSHNDRSVIGYEIVTTKKIKKSEELYNSYNRCNICEAVVDHHGTPEIFINFGFVEVMPQRWLFDFARVKFDLDWRDADESTGDLVVSFLVPPSARGIALLQEELVRLSSFGTKRDLDPKDAGIPESEWQSLWQYYHALKTALECAVEQSRDGNMTDEVWKLDENWWVKDGRITAEDDEEHWVYPTISV